MENHNKGPGSGGTQSTCFAHLAKGAKWKTVEDYLVDASNNAGLSDVFIRSNLASDIEQWEDAADGTINGVQGANILGNEVEGVVDRVNIGDLNNQNEVIFADVADAGAIAVTIVWGIFLGPPSGRELVEWDQIYDDTDFAWSENCLAEDCTSQGSEKMDFWNVAQHELGHAVGMGHPSDDCTEETMFRFASNGETKKRDLNAGDISGVKSLYS